MTGQRYLAAYRVENILVYALLKRIPLLMSGFLAVLMIGTTAWGQTNTYTYRFQDPGTTGIAVQLRYDVAPDVNAQALFTGSSSEQWKQLLESGYIVGTGTNLVRGQDVSEDYHLNWINPEVSDRNYYDNWWISGENLYVSSAGYPRVLANQGPHAGASVIANPNLLAMGDDNYLFWDDDDTISVYNYPGGTLETNYSWTTFSTGYWNGESLKSKLNLLIGYEEGYLYFLEGNSLIVRYNLAGTTNTTYTLTFANDSDLAGYTLGQLVDGEIDGFTYIGWDVGPVVIGVNAVIPIPEASSLAMVMLFGGALGILRFRKHKNKTHQE